MKRTFLAATLGLVLLVPAAHAQISETPVEALSSYRGGPPRPRRGCGPLRELRTLPTLGALGDSVAIIAALTDFARRHPVSGDSTPYGLYSVRIDAGGQVAGVETIEYWLPQSAAPALLSLVRAQLRGAGIAPTTLRVRARLGASPTVTAEYSQRCPAELRADFRLRTESPGAWRAQPSLHVRARVSADGQVVSANITRSSGDEEIDRWVQGTLMRSRAVPALIDGQPVDADVEEDIRVRMN